MTNSFGKGFASVKAPAVVPYRHKSFLLLPYSVFMPFYETATLHMNLSLPSTGQVHFLWIFPLCKLRYQRLISSRLLLSCLHIVSPASACLSTQVFTDFYEEKTDKTITDTHSFDFSLFLLLLLLSFCHKYELLIWVSSFSFHVIFQCLWLPFLHSVCLVYFPIFYT